MHPKFWVGLDFDVLCKAWKFHTPAWTTALTATQKRAFFVSFRKWVLYYLRSKMIIHWLRIWVTCNFSKILLAHKILWVLAVSTVYCLLSYVTYFWVKFWFEKKKKFWGEKKKSVNFSDWNIISALILCEKPTEFVYFSIILHYFGEIFFARTV